MPQSTGWPQVWLKQPRQFHAGDGHLAIGFGLVAISLYFIFIMQQAMLSKAALAAVFECQSEGTS